MSAPTTRAFCPIYVTFQARDQAHALEIKRKLAVVLANPMVMTLLASNGIQAEKVAVGDPAPLP